MAPSDDFAVFDHHRTNRDVTMSKSFSGLIQGQRHPAGVVGRISHWDVFFEMRWERSGMAEGL
ncbi:MAG: hypothetical protein AAFY88_10530, partial [Acidobacteriota bacterium]